MGALQVFIGFTAIAGGYQLVSHPKGTPAMPIEMLQASPFATFFIPGIVLLVFIGAVNVLSLVVTITGGRHRGSIAVVALGVVLLLSGLALRRMLLGATVSTDIGS
jgi:hypothetical protein